MAYPRAARGRRAMRPLLVGFICAAVTTIAAALAARACVGDCDSDGTVGIDELVVGVNLLFDTAGTGTCSAFDRNSDHRVTVNELVAAVDSALHDCAPQTATHAFVVTTNFTAGSFATVGLDEPRAVSLSTAQRRVHRDAVVRTHGGLVYVVNRRFADNIQLLDPDDGFSTRFQCSTGNGTNPHDIAFVDDTKAYVTLFEEAELLIVNPRPERNCSDFVRGGIDLGGAADADGIPDMDQMAIVGDRLYVALERLDINTVLRLPATNGAIAVIDTKTDTLVDTIELTGMNPFAATKGLTVRGDTLYVAQAGLFNQMDGGIERVDTTTGRAEGFFITEDTLGGDVTDFVIVSDRLGYAIVSQPGFTAALVGFDPVTGELTNELLSVDGFTLFDIELNDRGELFLADRERASDGLRIYRAADGMPLVDEPIDLGLPPFEIVFIP